MSQPEQGLIPPRRRFRWLKWLLILMGAIAVPTLATTAKVYYQDYLADQELQDAIAEVDRIDPGWRFHEIEANRADIPADQNSAVRILKAKSLMPSFKPAGPSAVPLNPDSTAPPANSHPPPNIQLSEMQIQELRAKLKEQSHALDEARLVADMPVGRYTIQWQPQPMYSIVGHVGDSYLVAGMLGNDAMLLAQDNQLEAAAKSGRAIFNTGRSIGYEPLLILQLVRVASINIAIEKMERILAQGELDESSLAAIQELVQQEDLEFPSVMISTLRGERAIAHQMWVKMAEPGFMDEEYHIPNVPIVRDVLGTGGRTVAKQINARCLRMATKYIEWRKLPLSTRLAKPWQMPDPKSGEDVEVACMLIQAYEKPAPAFTLHQARLRCAILALAAERYRQMLGFWPDCLEDLVDFGLIPAVPLDPFDEEPMRLKQTGDGLIVYSIGLDGEDDGGKLARINPAEKGTDIGFQLWDVDKRRQPPLPLPAEQK